MVGEIVIRIKSDISTEVSEMLGDKIANLLEKEGILAEIQDYKTGNSFWTRKGEKCESKEGSPDQNIRGILTFGEKIWFNDDLRCRLRICGFSNVQIEKLRNAKLVDLTIIDTTSNAPGVVVYISGFNNKDNKDNKD